ncbi:hypothetical protein J1N35_001873 [Gossypium stocksii]|uniref:Uncharacterized protein n=1 Tax=Gossypium stocksii TaxID=47602 RepID=A0A9D3WJM0_9ROSI|nr:hypothetical protein J1N35_001873 [Gossypium stocksii]
MVRTRGGGRSSGSGHGRPDCDYLRRLSDIKEGFLLHLHVLEAGFHLPFHPFFYHLLEEYGISHWAIVWFLVNLYQLKACNRGGSLGLFYFTPREDWCLELEEVLTVRNVFHFCLLDLSSNGWRPIDDRNGANTQSVLPAELAWPHRAIDELRLILVGKRVEPRIYFYTFYKLKPRSWSSKSTGIQECSTSTPINIVGADDRLVGNAGTTQAGEESTPSIESTSLSREIDTYMNVRSFM